MTAIPYMLFNVVIVEKFIALLMYPVVFFHCILAIAHSRSLWMFILLRSCALFVLGFSPSPRSPYKGGFLSFRCENWFGSGSLSRLSSRWSLELFERDGMLPACCF